MSTTKSASENQTTQAVQKDNTAKPSRAKTPEKQEKSINDIRQLVEDRTCSITDLLKRVWKQLNTLQTERPEWFKATTDRLFEDIRAIQTSLDKVHSRICGVESSELSPPSSPVVKVPKMKQDDFASRSVASAQPQSLDLGRILESVEDLRTNMENSQKSAKEGAEELTNQVVGLREILERDRDLSERCQIMGEENRQLRQVNAEQQQQLKDTQRRETGLESHLREEGSKRDQALKTYWEAFSEADADIRRGILNAREPNRAKALNSIRRRQLSAAASLLGALGAEITFFEEAGVLKAHPYDANNLDWYKNEGAHPVLQGEPAAILLFGWRMPDLKQAVLPLAGPVLDANTRDGDAR